MSSWDWLTIKLLNRFDMRMSMKSEKGSNITVQSEALYLTPPVLASY